MGDYLKYIKIYPEPEFPQEQLVQLNFVMNETLNGNPVVKLNITVNHSNHEEKNLQLPEFYFPNLVRPTSPALKITIANQALNKYLDVLYITGNINEGIKLLKHYINNPRYFIACFNCVSKIIRDSTPFSLSGEDIKAVEQVISLGTNEGLRKKFLCLFAESHKTYLVGCYSVSAMSLIFDWMQDSNPHMSNSIILIMIQYFIPSAHQESHHQLYDKVKPPKNILFAPTVVGGFKLAEPIEYVQGANERAAFK